MNLKRMTILLCLLLCIATAASASLASLDEALSPLLDGRGAVNMAVTMTVKTLMPFDETRLDLINRVLKHARLDARIDSGTEDSATGFQLALGHTALMEVSEQLRGGVYLTQSSLLPNRMLFSTQASPMDTLLASSEEESAEPENDTGLNTSDVEEAFDMMAAVRELEGSYRALIDKTVPLTKKNTPNYNIENIGKGRISYVAHLTAEQIEALLPELRAVIACGMDAEYREELSGVSFARGFTVALYQNSGGEDICVYIKGTMIYPDGDKRTLKWQWAFTPDGETQTFLHEAARESGTRDSRVVNSILKRTEAKESYTVSEETKVNLRRAGVSETSTLTVDLKGNSGGAPTCKGSVVRVTESTSGGESTGKKETGVTVSLSLTGTDGGAELTGTAVYKEIKDQTVQTELELIFVPAGAAAVNGSAEHEETAPAVEISIIPADPAAARLTAETPTSTAEEAQAVQPEFLVGTPPVGLYDYEIPPGMITINMDNAERKVHQSLMNEAAQRLAGNLILAILDLPAEDRELLSDGMTEADFAIFLAMLD